MTLFIHPPGSIGRTVFETDCRLFSQLADSEWAYDNIDKRLLIMLTTGLLNRSLNLEKYLIAALGQEWTFLHPVQVGQTLYCHYEVNLLKERKKVYQINIQLFAEQVKVADGKWTVMFKQLIH